jgi:hypothetical protein
VSKRRYARSKIELAKLIPVRYATLIAKFKDPRHPEDHSPGNERYDIEKWRRFLRETTSAHNSKIGLNGSNGTSRIPISERDKSVIDKNKVAAERQRLAVERERFELAVRMGEFLPKTIVLPAFERSHATARREIDKVIEVEFRRGWRW